MNDRSYLENHLLFIIYALGIVFFLVRIMAYIDGTWDEMTSDPGWIETTSKAQALVEVTIVSVFIMAVIPRWVNKIQSTPLNKTVQMGCSIAGIVILVWGIQEFTGKQLEFTETKIISIAVCAVVAVVFWLFAYWYGKKHKSDKKEDEPHEEQEQDEQ